MRAWLSFAYITCLLLCFTHQSLSQIGATKDELIKRYGPCQPGAALRSERNERAYQGVIDFGEDCTIRSEDLVMTIMFKDGKAVAFDYRIAIPYSDSLVSGDRWRKLWELDLLRLESMAIPNSRWVSIRTDSHLRQSRTKDSKVFSYYFADGHDERHHLLVQTAAVDAVFRKTEKIK